MKVKKDTGLYIVALVVTLGVSWSLPSHVAEAADIGEALSNVDILTTRKKPAVIPQFGKKALYIIYVDPDVKNKPENVITDALKKATDDGILDRKKFLGMGIVNTKDTWIPNFVIRAAIKSSIEEREKKGIPFKYSPIYVDQEHALKSKWQLGNCDDVDVVMVVGKDKKLKYLKRISTRAEAAAMAQKVIQSLVAAGAK
ncbi:MAG: YtfJ family protein [Myxococcota bacterium]|nr:YtfJ family protein [Myxococcota bacterium]